MEKSTPPQQKESPDYEGPYQGNCWAWQGGYNNAYDQLWSDPFRWLGHAFLFLSVAWSITTQDSLEWVYDYCGLDIIDADTRQVIARPFVHNNVNADGQYHISRYRVTGMESYFGRRLALRFFATTDISGITSCHYDLIEAYAIDQDMQADATVTAGVDDD